MTDELSRREFLGKTGLAAAGLGIGLATGGLLTKKAEAQEPVKPAPASERIQIGVIGCGGMGTGRLNGFKQNPDVDIVAVCDVYQPHRDRAVKASGGKATAYGDFRKLLEQKGLDAVVVATPDHWHAIPTILACQAGLDVFVEKPLAHSIGEGRAMVNAARRNKRVVQVGTQQRSGDHFQRAIGIVRSGRLGKITLVRTWNVGNESPHGMGNPPDCAPLPGLDWDMWLGPAPKRPFNPNRCLYTFRKFYDYAGGMMTDWGTHLIDIVHWAMAVDAPLTVSAAGGKFAVDDNRDTPDTLEVTYQYPGFVMVYSYRGCSAMQMDGHGYGIQFYGTNGTLFVDRGGYKVMPEGGRMEAISGGGSAQDEPHIRNFLDCVKSRNLPHSDIEIGHTSTTAPHLGNIAYRTGHKIVWDAKKEICVGDKDANRLLLREPRAPWKI